MIRSTLLTLFAFGVACALGAGASAGEKDHDGKVCKRHKEARHGRHLDGMAWRMNRPRIGVHIQPMSDDLRAFFKAPKERGVLVAELAPDSPGAKAGIKVGDVITVAGGEKIERPRDLIHAVADVEEGKSLKLTLVRDGREKQLSVTPEVLDDEEHAVKIRRFFKRGDHDAPGLRRSMARKLRGKIKEIEARLLELEKDMPKDEDKKKGI